MHRDEITSEHRARLACVYIRQSSLHQVRNNLESQRRQRALVERGVELGWPRERVVAIDDDLGISGSRSSSSKRLGFQGMIADLALGKIGLVLALEVTRLSRSSRDWHHLLDICAITSTLIADAESLYNPRAYNDRLLLGLKATMGEAELFVMRQRLVEAVRDKAARGELRIRLPPGYVWDEAGHIQMSADEQVLATIHLVFRRFNELGSIHQVHGSLLEDGVRFPVQVDRHGGVEWKIPSYRNIQLMLTHPIYAGVYVYGRRQAEEILDEHQQPAKRQRVMAREKWHAYIEDHHPGYIDHEAFERNLQRIAENRPRALNVGSPRAGSSLLQGLILCGRCGRRMRVSYGRAGGALYYRCQRKRRTVDESTMCQSFGAKRLEEAVERKVLEVLDPLALEAMSRAAQSHAEALCAEDRHWQQSIERAEYEAELVRRQFRVVDPDNRLVARELERRLESALEGVEAARREASNRRKELPKPLSEGEKARLLALANELPSVWRAPTTRPQDRVRIVRCLIEQVVVKVSEGEQQIRADVHWNGGEVSTLELARGHRGIHQELTVPELIELLRDLATEFSDAQIARIMHRRRLKTPRGLTFTAFRVAGIRRAHGIRSGPRLPRTGEQIYTALEAAGLLGVDRATVVRWVEVGLLKGAQRTMGAPWRIQVTPEDVRRLTAADVPKNWLSLKAAAIALGVSQHAVVQQLNSGQLEGVRVNTGRRTGWRIHLESKTYDDQLALFAPTTQEV